MNKCNIGEFDCFLRLKCNQNCSTCKAFECCTYCDYNSFCHKGELSLFDENDC